MRKSHFNFLQIWQSAPQNLKTRINLIVSKGNNSVLKKFEKDTSGFNQNTIPSNGIYVLNNRKQESAFGFLKNNDKKFLAMLKDNLGALAISQMNDLSKWLLSLTKNISTDMIKEAKTQRKTLVSKRKKSFEESRSKRREKMLRFAADISDAETSSDSEREDN